MTSPPIISFEGVTKRFGAAAAVDAVSLEIREGEFFALLGPSGCGKTTLLRMLAGFEAPTLGRILIDGRDVTDTPPNRRPVNMVFQSYAVFPHMSVFDNIAYGLRIERLPARAIAERVEAALARVQLEGYGGRRPDQLSGGQRQRVALARALIKRPRVLLLDEPLSALDAKLRDEMRQELATLQTDLGITFIMVTHDQDEALALATRCAVMNRGRLEQVATPAELYERPNSRFVADFIGSINLFEGALRLDANDGAWLTAPDLEAPVFMASQPAAAIPGPVWAAIRPEKIEMRAREDDAPPPQARDAPAGCNVAAGVIRTSHYLGSESVFGVTLATGRTIKVTRPNLGATDQAAFGLAQPVWLSWRADAAALLSS